MNSVIITGTSKGLGAEIAKQINKKGYYHYALSRYNDINVSDYQNVKDFFDGLMHDDFGIPTALINNAGVCYQGNIFSMSIENWQEQINTNLNACFYTCKEYIKLCKLNNIKGKIINIASTAGLASRAGRAGYAASKAGLISFSLSLAEEVKDYGIKVFIVCPEAFDSDLRRNLKLEENYDNMLKPENVATFVINLIENGDFLDNQILHVRKGSENKC